MLGLPQIVLVQGIHNPDVLQDADFSVGIVLFDGLSGHEEEGNEVLADLAPMLSFVGGSAADDLQFSNTKVFCNGEETAKGAALMLIEAAVPFSIGKSCSYAPTDKTFRITCADPLNRIVYELDGRPVLEVYAEAVGTARPPDPGSRLAAVEQTPD